MTIVRSTLFNAWFFGISFLSIILLMLTLPLPRAVLTCGLKIWMKMIMAGLRIFVGLHYEVRGHENIPRGPAVFTSKHQSAWETGIFFIILEDASYVLKRELLSIPLYGRLLRKAKMVSINRDGAASALRQMVLDCRSVIEDHRQLVIFPEGTRSQPGQKFPYHPGIAAIYKQTGVPIIPVALNSGMFWGRRAFAKRSGKIVIEFLPPMPQGLNRKAFMAELENRIERASNQLFIEANINLN